MLVDERGLTLTELIVGAFISGVLVLVAGSFLIAKSRMSANFQVLKDVIDFRGAILRKLDCANTLLGVTSCPNPGVYISVKDHFNNQIIQVPVQNTYTVLAGTYYFRASCVACSTCTNGKMLFIEYALGPGAPTYGNSGGQTWSDLLSGIPIACVIP